MDADRQTYEAVSLLDGKGHRGAYAPSPAFVDNPVDNPRKCGQMFYHHASDRGTVCYTTFKQAYCIS